MSQPTAETERPALPRLPDVTMNVATPRSPVTGRVAESRLCSVGRKSAGYTRHVAFDVSGTPLAGITRPGQSFGVLAPGNADNGKPHKVRLYSVSSPTRGEDGAGNVIATCVKRLIDEHWESHKLFLGVTSNFICDLREGDDVQLTGPAGKRFICPEDAGDWNYLFISTGTGIAPFRGMAIDLLEAGCTKPVTLISGSTYASDLLYHAEFLELKQKHANFSYHTAISRERQEDGHDPMYVDRRLDTERETLLPLLTDERTLIYICGIAGMELGIFKRLANLLTGDALDQYLHVDREMLANIDGWTKQDLAKGVKKTERVFTEVYD